MMRGFIRHMRVNFGLEGVWAYRLDAVASTGSTSPLWTFLLAVGYVIKMPYLGWSYGLGLGTWLLLLWSGMGVVRHLWPQWVARDWLVGLILVMIWPLAWASVSGMETLLFAALGMTVWWQYLILIDKASATQSASILLGLLLGALILTRPDGIALIGLVFAGLVWRFKRQPLVLGGRGGWLFTIGCPLLSF